MIDRILIVRLGALGDIVHALPAAVALREAFPAARIDWLVSSRHRAVLEHLAPPAPGGRPVIDRHIVLERRKSTSGAFLASWKRRPSDDQPLFLTEAIGLLRKADYDVAFDMQGLMKSAVLARSSGARRVIGFSTAHLRERWAHLFYTETIEPSDGVHVIEKNLALLRAVGVEQAPVRFPALGLQEDQSGSGFQRADFVIINPGAGWPNKRWPPEWFGDIARRVHAKYGLATVVLWGPGEETLARLVVAASHGAARLAPATDIGEMIALIKDGALLVAGDTGPLHLAAAVDTPIVGLYGPTNPARNGPWRPDDVTLSRFDRCECHYRRRCVRDACCLLDITVDDVMDAVERRLGARAPHA